MRFVTLSLIATALTACQTAPVYLQHPVTKEIAKCGPYDARVAHYGSSVERERGCIQDFQRQGVVGSEFVLPVRRLAKNGFEAWAEVIAHDYEGLVAKEEASLYEAGPTRRWLKVKQKGWTDGQDRWKRRIGA
jgi:hypothetical protein